MDAIISYLDNMFAHLPRTSEVQRAKEELQQMMEDKYLQLKREGRSENEAVGQVIAEFGNLEELADQLGITNQVSMAGSPEGRIEMSQAEVDRFLNDTAKSSSRIAFGVLLCILSGTPLLAMKIIQQSGILEERTANALGIGALLIMVATAIYFFIVHGMSTEKYADLERTTVAIEPQVQHRIRILKEDFRPVFARMIGGGVLMIMLGVFLVTILGVLEMPEERILLGVIALLACVAIAVSLFIRGGMRSEAYDQLLNEGEYTTESKKGNRLVDSISGPYWMIVVLAFFGWGFLGNAWHISWIVFPIGGVLYALLRSIARAIQDRR